MEVLSWKLPITKQVGSCSHIVRKSWKIFHQKTVVSKSDDSALLVSHMVIEGEFGNGEKNA